MTGEVVVLDVPAANRYEARIDSELAGTAVYRLRPGHITFVHTEVGGAFEGHGVGSRLASAVLDDVVSRGLAVVVRCPFIAAYVRRHAAEYPDVELRD